MIREIKLKQSKDPKHFFYGNWLNMEGDPFMCQAFGELLGATSSGTLVASNRAFKGSVLVRVAYTNMGFATRIFLKGQLFKSAYTASDALLTADSPTKVYLKWRADDAS